MSLRCQREGARPSLVAEEATGAVAIGVVEVGAVGTGVAAIGTTGTAIGVIIIIITMMSSSLAASAFRGGGAGAIRTDITDMDTRTITMDMVMDMDMAMMATATDPITGTALPADQGSLSCNADLLAPAIIGAPSMVSWGLKREEQFGLTSATT
jgi:hypothetical protein